MDLVLLDGGVGPGVTGFTGDGVVTGFTGDGFGVTGVTGFYR